MSARYARAGLLIDHSNTFWQPLVAEELAVAAIELPENPRLADREHHFLIADVDQTRSNTSSRSSDSPGACW
jgi:hypothetical protein